MKNSSLLSLDIFLKIYSSQLIRLLRKSDSGNDQKLVKKQGAAIDEGPKRNRTRLPSLSPSLRLVRSVNPWLLSLYGELQVR